MGLFDEVDAGNVGIFLTKHATECYQCSRAKLRGQYCHIGQQLFDRFQQIKEDHKQGGLHNG